MITRRRSFLIGLGAAIAAPAIVRAANIMPVRALRPPLQNPLPAGWLPCDGRVVSRSEFGALFDVLTKYFPPNECGATCVPTILGAGDSVSRSSTAASLIPITYGINASDPRLPIGQIVPFLGKGRS